MITIIVIVFVLYLLAEAFKGAARRSQRKREARAEAALQREIDRLYQLEASDYTAIIQVQEEQKRQAEAVRKLEKRVSDLEFKKEQAEADILGEQSKLDHYTARLSAYDEQIEKIDRDIEYYQLANKVDAEAKARKDRAKIEDNIFKLENQVRACEKRMSKAEHIRKQAERELLEVA